MKPQTKQKLEQLKLHSFIEVFDEIVMNKTTSLSLEESLSMMVDREVLSRENRRLNRLLKAAKLRYPSACITGIDYKQPRQFKQDYWRDLTHCEWVNKTRNVILVGPTGVGKSYMACALGHQTCLMGRSVRYYRVARLIEMLHLSHADGSYGKLLDQLAKLPLLILDDWGIDQLDRQARRDLLEVMEDRYAKASTIITTQLPLDSWHQFIGDDTIADAICDRIINNSHIIDIAGESMRKVESLTHVAHSVTS